MTGQRLQCSAAPVYRDWHMATDWQYPLTDPDGAQFVFCSGCCLLTYAVHGALSADIKPRHTATIAGEAA